MEQTNTLQQSVRYFDEKKKECLDFIDATISELEDFQKAFPSGEPASPAQAAPAKGQEQKPALPAVPSRVSRSESSGFLSRLPGGLGKKLMNFFGEEEQQPTASPGSEAFSQEEQPEVLDHLGQLRQCRKKIEDSSLKILVAGQFKTGKSTMINAMLREEVLPADVRPCTAVLTEILYGEQKKAVLSFKKELGKLPADLYDKARRHIQSHGSRNVPDLTIEGDLGTELENYLTIPMSDQEQSESVAESPYALCKLYWPLELCQNGSAAIIDSPGLNEATARDRTTLTYVPQADMIIHVLTALQLYGMPDKQFVQRVESMGSHPILFVINRIDQLNTDKERERIRKYALQQLLGHSTYHEHGIFFLSAQNALDGAVDKNADLLRESGLTSLESQIAYLFKNDRIRIKLGNVSVACRILHNIVETRLPSLSQMMDRSGSELERLNQECQVIFDRLDGYKRSISKAVDRGMTTIEDRMIRGVQDFFSSFIASRMQQLVDAARLPDIGFFSVSEDCQKCSDALMQALQDGLFASFSKWNAQEGNGILARALDEIGADLEESVVQFEREIANLRAKIAMDGAGGDSTAQDTISAIRKTMNTAIWGQDNGFGSMAIATNFLAEINGEADGFLAGFIKKIQAAFNTEQTHARIRHSFMREAQASLYSSRDKWTRDIVGKAVREYRRQLKEIGVSLQDRIDSYKVPLKQAIKHYKADQEQIKKQREQLQDFRKKFSALCSRGDDLFGSL